MSVSPARLASLLLLTAITACDAEEQADALPEGDKVAVSTATLDSLDARLLAAESQISLLSATVLAQSTTIAQQNNTIAILQGSLAGYTAAQDLIATGLEAVEDDVTALESDLSDAAALLEMHDMDIVTLAAAAPLPDQVDFLAALEDNVTITTNAFGGEDVVFSGVNVFIQSGSGSTDGAVNGLGNLTLGYNELGYYYTASDRTGSHNLIVGEANTYVGYGGIVSGFGNYVGGSYPVAHGSGSEVYDSGFVAGAYYNYAEDGGVALGPFASATYGEVEF